MTEEERKACEAKAIELKGRMATVLAAVQRKERPA